MADKFKWGRYGGYDVSISGDKRFNDAYAVLPDGHTIQEHHRHNLDIRSGNEECPTRFPHYRIPMEPEINPWAEYLSLWVDWGRANPALIEDLRIRAKAKGCLITDSISVSLINPAAALCWILNHD